IEKSGTVRLCACGGRLYAIASAFGSYKETQDELLMYSLDLDSRKWREEPKLPCDASGIDVAASNGRLYAMFGYISDSTLTTAERLCGSVYSFDGIKWEKKNDEKLIGRVHANHGDITRRETVTSVKNGLLFVGASADGGGNVFLYNTSEDKLEPLYYTTSDSLSDTCGRYSSCVAARDGIYYIRQVKDDYRQGWALSLLPESSGAYETPYFVPILGDVDGDGSVTIADATLIQKAAIDLVPFADWQKTAGDVNKDGRISVLDATFVQRWLANMEAPSGIGKPVDYVDELSLWTETAPLKSELTAYMNAITDKNSPDFIPVEARIAVFDMDGTLCCETDPGYFDHKLLYHRVMEDPEYKDKASDFEKEVCSDIKEYFDTGVYPKGMDVRHGTAVATAFKGMTPEEFDAYVKAYRDAPMNSYTNMTTGQAFYKPMLQVVDYLQANGFKVYIVSGTDRLITRGLAEGMINIPLAQMIGSDESLVATGQGDTDGLSYTFTHDDELITGGDFLIKNLKMNKVTAIEREIGLQPVLCFGNSSGDAAMANYTITNNKYRSGAYLLCCDDLDRENGNLSKAESMRQSCEKNGWTAVSMKNDWTTIYGEGVEYVK
ncbi:MAG: haloacid dehalogenase-like hydrolase, partial [Ruminococcus sp.]|nr:haloacid dehalogenase-like hydrolase [Ruminococcus sp.]